MQEAPPAPPLPGPDPDSVTMLAPPAPLLPPLPLTQAPPAPPLPGLEPRPRFGPMDPRITRCINAYPIGDPWDDYCTKYMYVKYGFESTHCASCTGDSEHIIEHPPRLGGGYNCIDCMRMRGHYTVGYKRPDGCRCPWCQHHPVPLVLHNRDNEVEWVGLC